MKKIEISKEQLEQLYIVEKKSLQETADILNIGKTTVTRKLKQYDIPIRSIQEAGDLRNKSGIKNTHKKRTCICKNCGKEFEAVTNASYCKECVPIVASINLSKKIKVKCGYCGKEIEVIPSKLKDREKVYCDVKCMALDYADRFSGENSPTWKGGKKHYTGHWQRQRKLALERDNNTCQICGITTEQQGFELDVHHICNYRNFDDKDEANQLDNLICLCHNCHRFIHSNSNIDKLYIKNKIQSDLISDNELT